MQDYPKLLLQASKEIEVNRTGLVVTFPRFMAWSPVKNDYQRAALLKAKTGFEESPRSGEADILALFRKDILLLGAARKQHRKCQAPDNEQSFHRHIIVQIYKNNPIYELKTEKIRAQHPGKAKKRGQPCYPLFFRYV